MHPSPSREEHRRASPPGTRSSPENSRRATGKHENLTPGHRVLIVEDSFLVGTEFQIALLEAGYEGGEIAMIIVAHNYAQVFDVCDRINLVEGGMIAFDKRTAETSVQELTDRVVRQYRSVREIVRLARKAQ